MSERDDTFDQPMRAGQPDADGELPHRRSRWWLWTLLGVVAFFVLLFGGAMWVINTESGTQWAANRAIGFLGGKLAIREIDGTLAGPLTVKGVRWNDPDSGADVRIASATVDAALMELLSKRVHVTLATINGVDVRLSEPLEKEEEEKKPFSLTPPIDLVLDSFALKDARISRDGEELFVIRAAEASAAWTAREGIIVRKLAVDSPDGNVHLTAEVAGGARDGTTAPVAGTPASSGADATLEELASYTARVNGGFRWKVADAQYVGELTANSAQKKLTAQVRLSEPMVARVDATVEETSSLPWQLNLSVPQFDPRKGLLPDSSIQSLAATLAAHGDLTFAELRGDVSMNGQSLRIDPARIRYQEQLLTIETLKLLDPKRRGSLTAKGDVRLAEQIHANLDVSWQDVELPKEWVGQPLGTHGEIKVNGTPQTFAANGNLAIGPPGRLAAIDLDVNGTPEQIKIQRFSIVQKAGNLTATGQVLLQPRIGWQINARARAFNPGELVAGWPGNLGFALDTQGELQEKGPNASLELQNLNGTLRGRPLAGQADLEVNPDMVVSGTLDLRSGKSSVSLAGRGGSSMDVDVELAIASLDDWLPRAGGRFNGMFHVTGTWPKLAISGNAQGRELAYTGYSVKSIDIDADVKNPTSPAGTAKISASEIIAAGFEFSKIDLDASGDEKAHTVHLKATGQPLSTEVNVQGARAGEDGWSGTVDKLDIAVTGISPLALREPVKVAYNPRAFSVSRSCLAGDQLSACVSAAQNESGELNAEYTLEHLPLGLVAAIAAPDMPVHIEAVIEGNGNFRRTKDGAMFGEAHVSSGSGRITEAGAEPREDASDALLTYENLKLDAQLAGETAQGTLSSSLNNGGSLSGEVSVANISGAAPTIDGQAKLSIPDLSPVGLFVPQLANVKGAGEANVQVTGTISAPQITGTAQLRDLAAEVPQVGIKLRDGLIDASIDPGNAVRITGKLSSGKGELAINGTTLEDGTLRVKAQGKEFQAADMPGANVVVAPDLTFERSPERMLLYGQVTIPRAAIDLSKLPKTPGGTAVSPDVVVIDDDEDIIEQSKQVPLEVNVGLIIGKAQNNNTLVGFEEKDSVTLMGYGLNARVDGWLDVHERPGEPTTGNGEIHLSGIYKAYGQDLTIQQGRLLFAGQEITDPQVNIVATRTVDAVTAKLTVSGSASKPQLEVSADPTMSQTQALSYLVTGKPINEVGSGEGDLVQSAARSLGGAAGNLLAKGLGQRLGISQIGVEDNEEIGGSAFTVGQYLSPRLYLSYGVGLFEPGQVVTLRYRINDKLSLEAAQGPLNQKAGINYRIERR